MIELSPKYKQILTTDKRYVILTGGRGSGKSFAVSTIANLATYERDVRVLYTRYTLLSADISIIPEFEEKLDLLEVRDNFDVKKKANVITNKATESDILFRGIKSASGNQTANLKSIQGVSIWILDEAEELVDEDTFEKIDFSIRTKDAKNMIILILNPTHSQHWIWRRFFENNMRYEYIDGFKIPISNHPDVLHIHTIYRDNKENLSEGFVNQAEKMKEENPDKYYRIMLGGWNENTEGAIYSNWKEGAFDNSLPYVYGLDFGYYPDPTAMIKVAMDKKKKKLYVKEEIYDTELSNKALREKVRTSVGRMNDLVSCDHDKRMIAELADEGINVKRAIKGKDSVINGIRKVQDYEIIVDYNSHNLKKELRNYAWNDKKADLPQDNWNHLMDAMRYAFEELIRKKRKGLRFFR